MANCGHASEAKPSTAWRQQAAKAVSLGGAVVAISTKSLIHPTYRIYSIYWVYSIYSPRKKQHSLLVLPSVHTIINFATKFFDMLTKKQSEHP